MPGPPYVAEIADGKQRKVTLYDIDGVTHNTDNPLPVLTLAGVTCYNNGFAFEAADEATALTKVGTTNDLNFAIFSVQDIYLINFSGKIDATPGDNSLITLYTKTKDYKRFNTLVASTVGFTPVKLDNLKDMPPFVEKGGMIKAEYSDDYTDDVSSVRMGIRCVYIPPIVNG